MSQAYDEFYTRKDDVLTSPQTLGDATVVTNPVGPVYTAILPTEEFFNPADPRGNVKGGISATAGPGGVGVAFTVNFSNLPTSGGPFRKYRLPESQILSLSHVVYHIHVMPINSSGSCASAAGHLDPFLRGEQPACDPTKPQTCQVGDLSGKYGKVTSDPFTASYVDLYTSLVPGTASFFGNRSFVFHFANTTKITCASFSLVPGTAPANYSTATTSSTPALFTGSATGLTASLLSVFGALAAALLL